MWAVNAAKLQNSVLTIWFGAESVCGGASLVGESRCSYFPKRATRTYDIFCFHRYYLRSFFCGTAVSGGHARSVGILTLNGWRATCHHFPCMTRVRTTQLATRAPWPESWHRAASPGSARSSPPHPTTTDNTHPLPHPPTQGTTP